ncbi:MAG: TolC family protein [Bacteroidales bacterium]
MKIRFLFLSIFIMFLFGSSNAQVVYDLTDCIRTGLEKNFSLLVTKNDEAISKNNFTPGNAGYLPTLDLTAKQIGVLNDSRQRNTDGTQLISNNVFSTTSYGSVSLGWNIFNGFSVQTTYKKLNELKQIGELNTQMTVENLIANIISGYYNCIQQEQMLKNKRYAVALSRERLRIDEDRYLLGSGSKLQVLQSRVYFNSDSSSLAMQIEVVRAAKISLNELMAVDNLGELFISKDTSILLNPELLYEKLLDETMAKNTSLLIASKNKTISEYDYKLIKSRSYPYMNLSSGYNYNYYTYSAGIEKNLVTDGMNYGVTVGVNIFDGMNQRRSIRNSSIDVKNKELKYNEIQQGVKADLITIYGAYSNYLRLISLEEQNLQTATENLDIAMERYKLGSLSGIDLREVQKSLLDAKESLLSVEYQAKLAEISLMLISGKIMDYYK